MNKGLKLAALAVDVAFMPVRFLIGLEITLMSAIINEYDMKDGVSALVDEFKSYPKKVVDCLNYILNEEEF